MEMGGSDVAASTCDIETPSQTIAMKSPLSPLRCIHRVPDRFRRESKKDYTPRVISIGPYHHRNPDLKRMEVHKRWYLNCFMERSRSQSSHSQNDYIDKIREQKEKLQKCYTETIELTGDEFVTMVLVDAIFLIEFLLRYSHRDLRDENDCIFGIPMMFPDVKNDLLMLENQLPLFILEDLFSLYNRESGGVAKLLSIQFLIDQVSCSFGVELKQHFVDPSKVEGQHFVDPSQVEGQHFVDPSQVEGQHFVDPSKVEGQHFVDPSKVEGQHFVDLLRNLLVAPLLKEKLKGETLSAIAPSIEKLHLAGGKIHGETSNPNLFAIRFDDKWILKNGIPKNGTLKIPKLRIEDSTELILRNLIAIEQCSMSKDPIICHYVILMDMLVDSPKDAELLVKHNIVENALLGGDDELSSMINRLSRGIVCDTDQFYYSALCEKMGKFCNSNWPKWMKNLRSKYFNTPWATLSVVAAVVLLIFTAIQTICSVYPR